MRFARNKKKCLSLLEAKTIRFLLVQQVARLRLLHCGLLPQGELTEADLHLLRAGRSEADRLAARLGFLDQALTATDPATSLAMLSLL